MTEDREPIDDLLRSLAGTPNPDLGAREYARLRLEAEIASFVSARPPRKRIAWVVGLAALSITVLAVLGPWRATPVEAAIGEIVRVAEPVDPSDMTDDTYLYVVEEDLSLVAVPGDRLESVSFGKEELVYQLRVIRERWIGNEGTTRLTTTATEPIFFSEPDRAAYFEAGLDQQDQIGEPTTITVRDESFDEWPTRENELDSAIRAEMTADRGLPEDIEYLDVALDIVRSPLTPLDTRWAALTLISRVNSLQLTSSERDRQTFSVEYSDEQGELRLTFTLDSDGYLRFEETRLVTASEQLGLPAGTPITSVTYSAPQRVDTLPKD